MRCFELGSCSGQWLLPRDGQISPLATAAEMRACQGRGMLVSDAQGGRWRMGPLLEPPPGPGLRVSADPSGPSIPRPCRAALHAQALDADAGNPGQDRGIRAAGGGAWKRPWGEKGRGNKSSRIWDSEILSGAARMPLGCPGPSHGPSHGPSKSPGPSPSPICPRPRLGLL
jgi:hypothetical protein